MDPTNSPQLLSFWNKNEVSYVNKQSEFSAKKATLHISLLYTEGLSFRR